MIFLVFKRIINENNLRVRSVIEMYVYGRCMWRYIYIYICIYIKIYILYSFFSLLFFFIL